MYLTSGASANGSAARAILENDQSLQQVSSREAEKQTIFNVKTGTEFVRKEKSTGKKSRASVEHFSLRSHVARLDAGAGLLAWGLLALRVVGGEVVGSAAPES